MASSALPHWNQCGCIIIAGSALTMAFRITAFAEFDLQCYFLGRDMARYLVSQRRKINDARALYYGPVPRKNTPEMEK